MSRLTAIAIRTTAINIGQCQTNDRPAFKADSTGSLSELVVGRCRIRASVTRETTKVAASTSSANPTPVSDGLTPLVPRAAIATPAIAGPRKTLNWVVPWVIALAVAISSGATTAGMIACWAG